MTVNNRMARHTNYGGGVSVSVVLEAFELEHTHNSHRSPSNLVYARSHAELAGRKDRPLNEGLSLREPLETKDYTNWE